MHIFSRLTFSILGFILLHSPIAGAYDHSKAVCSCECYYDCSAKNCKGEWESKVIYNVSVATGGWGQTLCAASDWQKQCRAQCDATAAKHCKEVFPPSSWYCSRYDEHKVSFRFCDYYFGGKKL